MPALSTETLPAQTKPAARTILVALVLAAGVVFLTLAIYWTVARTNALQPDFFTFWTAGRAFFLEHLSPYSPEVSLRSQLGIYGRAALPGEDQVGYAYPLHSLWLVLPTVWMNFPLATSFWMSFNLMLTITVLYLAFPKRSKLLIVSFLFFYPFAYGLLIGNYSLLLGILFLIVYGCIIIGKKPSARIQFLCGILLSVLTIKPQLMGILLIAVFLFVLGKKLYLVLAGFGAGLFGMVGSITLWFPNWPGEWIRRLMEYSAYQADNQPLAMIYSGWILPEPYSKWLGYGLIGGAAILTVVIGIRWWRGKVSSACWFAWCALVTLFIDRFQWSSEQIILLVPLLFWTFTVSNMKVQRMAFWFAALGFSWFSFAASLKGWAPGAVDQWPFLFYLVWIGFVFFRDRSSPLTASQVRAV